MSITRKQLITGSLITVSAVAIGLSTFTVSAMHSSAKAQEALQNKDYEGYKAAIVENTQTRANNLSEAEFEQMASKNESRLAVQQAIQNNDYVAYQKATASLPRAQATTQAEFDQLVAKYKTREEHKLKVEEAIKNNDFEQFKILHQELQNNKETQTRRSHIRELSEEELKARFEELVQYYKDNGKMPERGLGFGGNGMDHGRGNRISQGPKGIHL